MADVNNLTIEQLAELKNKTLVCENCHLRAGCRGVVFGEGDPFSPIMLVGEGPGQTEDELGRPFVGKAGQLLDRILESVDLPRNTIYITNIVKCRPANNRTPTQEEMKYCLPWLREQFRILRPRFMVLLGLAATHGILAPDLKMNQIHGKWVERGKVSMMPTYHPAAILRNPNLKRPAWEDFKEISRAVNAFKGE